MRRDESFQKDATMIYLPISAYDAGTISRLLKLAAQYVMRQAPPSAAEFLAKRLSGAADDLDKAIKDAEREMELNPFYKEEG